MAADRVIDDAVVGAQQKAATTEVIIIGTTRTVRVQIGGGQVDVEQAGRYRRRKANLATAAME